MFATISLAPINDPIFDPPTVFTPSVAAVNITFVFDGPGTYSVTQSSFEQPCVPLEGGFDTGIIHGSLIGNSTQALLTLGTIGEIVWFFSRPTPPALCDSSTVGAINPPTTGDQTFNDFLLNANSAGLNNITATEHKSASPASATSIGLSPLATVTQSNQSNGYSISPMGL
ncbi:hypothetical protein BDP27DRAFT_1417740 [Rhodocollybia butyracea]|uniref:Uncharacterized protein n=1 Tax=Rhodocollybia butyracea TaxID=206335 RepID=A0A9P5PV27_9AGAR|nr:hypothetical protein BDP27DRAFT_1417740 [Rhodocollybia butyracea]